LHQSGKIVAYSATALSAALMLGIAALGIAAPLIVLGQGPHSDQAKMSAEDRAIAEARALAAAVSGHSEQSPAPSDALPPPREWSPLEVGAALMQCVTLLGPVRADIIPLAPLRYQDCGTPAPVLLRSIGAREKVVFDPPLLMNCPMVAALARWMEKTVQPAARATLGSPVVRIAGSSYACRNLYNLPDARRSQHAYANAVDLPVFFLADGRMITLTQGWGPTHRDLVAGMKLVPIVAKAPDAAADGGVTTAEMKTPVRQDKREMTVVKASTAQPAEGAGSDATPAPNAAPLTDPLAAPEAKFFRRVHQGACGVFTTVLGPEANDVHRSHLHLDLQDRHALNVCH
jgi:hypothetical protein